MIPQPLISHINVPSSALYSPGCRRPRIDLIEVIKMLNRLDVIEIKKQCLGWGEIQEQGHIILSFERDHSGAKLSAFSDKG